MRLVGPEYHIVRATDMPMIAEDGRHSAAAQSAFYPSSHRFVEIFASRLLFCAAEVT